ncbi:uncharacterized protein LOC103848062 [Brassica rapa]|uniref:uncharacterized protein LOC103848062 n=1 Tax=Brassica campestris TaxID=3711 RepID=UPI0004F1BE1E|nr:uncharacterized protein LOC103848062 [Brassica rapa]XP_013646957.1 uncharacterized protein LOC106351751 isoform X1 [Brassica napus]
MSITEENPLKPRFPLHCNFLDCLSFTLYILLFSSFSSLPKLQKSKNLSKLLQSKLRDYLTNNGRKVDSVQFKGSFCRSNDHMDDAASSTETSHGRGLVSMLMWIMNCPSLLLTLLGRPSLFSSCYERSTSLPSIKPSPSPVLLLSVSMHHSQTFWRWSSTWS